MDKLNWLEKMVEQNPDDSQAHYFLGKELAENGRYVEAVQSLSTAISKCTDETLKMEMIQELTKISLKMSEEVNSTVEHREPKGEIDYVSSLIKEVDEENEERFLDTEWKVESESEHVEHGYEKSKATGFIQLQKQYKQTFKVVDGGEKRSVKKEKKAITFEDVAGLEDLKKTIHLRIISPFYNKGLFAKFRKKAGGGVLLYGPPGCGKTFIARATAGECRANFYPVHITDILDSYKGVSEQNLKDIFDKARFQKPSILFFDEVDTIGYSRAKSANEYNRGVIDTFLVELDGIDSTTDEVLVIAATNTPWDVDNALKRPGRFDRLIFVAPPDEKAREEIFKLKLSGRYAEEIDVARLASITEFFSGADIENVVELATERVLEEIITTGIERPIKTNDLLEVVETVQPSTLDWLRTAKNYVKYANHGGLYNDVEAYLRKYGKRI